MKIVIDPNDVVSEAVAVAMVAKILERDDGTVRFTDGTSVEIRTAKTQKSFKVIGEDPKVVAADTSEG